VVVVVDAYEYGGGGPEYMAVGLGSGAVEMLRPAIIEYLK
jgi:hypothetical protein